jgi:peptidoglycan biosynthesis protein MviN/MurJ (putative lipid II flippase)
MAGVGALAALLAAWAAAVTLWWTTVRRRQHNVWSAGFQIACIPALAQLIALAVIVTDAVAPTEQLQWQDVVNKALPPQLVLTPFRFVGAVLLIAVGRMLPGTGGGTLPLTPASSPEHREGVT